VMQYWEHFEVALLDVFVRLLVQLFEQLVRD
jgi:hypothetical protein